MSNFNINDDWCPECCRYCNNNPKNNPNASGVCSCILPTMERNGYRGKGDYNNTFTTNHTEYIFYKEN